MNKTYKVKTINIAGNKLHVGDTVAWHTSRYIPAYDNPYEAELDENVGQRVSVKKIVIIYDIEKEITNYGICYNIIFDNGETKTLWDNELANATIYKVNISPDFDRLNLVPKDWKELNYVVHYFIAHYGKNADLNCIDVSNITNMDSLFRCSNFNGNISKWNVSKVVSMNYMFDHSCFNGNISSWEVTKVKYHDKIFNKCKIRKENRPKFLN